MVEESTPIPLDLIYSQADENEKTKMNEIIPIVRRKSWPRGDKVIKWMCIKLKETP